MNVDKMPRPRVSSFRRPNTQAPPPSPKSTHVLRSVQSNQALSFSAPITNAYWIAPVATMHFAISSA